MKILLKKALPLLVASLTSIASVKGATVTSDPGAAWLGFMNVFETPQNSGGFVFGSSWGTADLTANFSGTTLTLGPNTIGDPNSFWYTPSGGPGAVGNKTMDASMYVETTGVYSGQTLNFTANVLANTLVGSVNQLGNGWTAKAFIKDFAPDYSSSISATADLTAGTFNLSLATIPDPSRHVQYGFEVVGPDVWATDVSGFGNIQVAAVAVPEPASAGLIGLGVLALAASRRMRK
jgi:PEP-CTERM motif-containing protein